MSKKDDYINIKNLEKLSFINSGSFGDVFKVRNIQTDKIYAAKISKKSFYNIPKKDVKNIRREVNINAKLHHPAIAKFIGYSPIDFSGNPNPVIIIDYFPKNSLHEVLFSNKYDEWDSTKKLINIYGIASGMSYLHKYNIIHRDLKPGNILMDDNLYPKIADFGLSKILHNNIESQTEESTELAKGTPSFLSPEIWTDSLYTKAGDVYAYAFIVYQIMTNSNPYQNLKWFSISYQVIDGKRPPLDDTIPNPYKELISKCWSQNPDDRPEFYQIVDFLRTDERFHESIKIEEFKNYVKYIDQSKIEFDPQVIIEIEYELNSNDNFLNDDSKSGENSEQQTDECIENNECLDVDVDADSRYQFLLAKNLIEGNENIEKDIEKGIKYLEQSASQGYIESIVYYCQMLIKGDIIPKDELKAKKFLIMYLKENNGKIFNLYGKILKKEKKYSDARKFFSDGSNVGNGESMYEYGKMLFLGKGGDSNVVNSIKYFELAKNCGNLKSATFLSVYNKMNQIECFQKIPIKIQYSFINQIKKYFCKNFDVSIQKVQILNDENIKNMTLVISEKQIKNLFQLKVFDIPNFVDFLKIFKEVYVSVSFSSQSFKSIFDFFLNFKQIKNLNVKVSIFIEGLRYLTYKFGSNQIIDKVIIDSPTQTIKDEVFSGCSALTEISIPPSLLSIGNYSFSGCSKLEKISIPSCLTSIGKYAFYGCSSLKQVSIQSLEQKTSNYILGQISNFFFTNSIDESAFGGCTSLRQITIPDSITKISNFAFYGCSSLDQISIQNSVKSIGNFVFSGCSSLTQITIPPSITTIDESTFYKCALLTKINLPNSLTLIKKSAFSQCSSLFEIIIPSSVKLIEELAFSGCSKLEKIVIDPYLTKYELNSFENCTLLHHFEFSSSVEKIHKGFNLIELGEITKITVPFSVTLIESSSFKNFQSIKEITISPSVSEIGEFAFSGCCNLEKVIIDPYQTQLKSNSFENCSSLLNFEFFSSVTSIQQFNFSELGKIEKITIPKTVETIGNYSFYSFSTLKEIEIPESVKNIGKQSFCSCSKLEKVTILSKINSISPCTFKGCSSLKEIEIPESVNTIGNYAFSDCSSLIEIKIPSEVKTMGVGVFKGCSSLIKIKIPDSLSLISFSAFNGCSSLVSINIPCCVKSIGNFAFAGCFNLSDVFLNSSVIESIGVSAFSGCSSLCKISIPSSVKSIGDLAFSGCSSLKNVEIPSSTTVGESAFNGCPALQDNQLFI